MEKLHFNFYSTKQVLNFFQSITETISEGDPEDIIITQFNLNITRSDIERLQPGRWLNDQIINFCFKLIEDRVNGDPLSCFKCFFYSSFCYPVLTRLGGAARMCSTTTRSGAHLLQYDKIIIPIHKQSHWTLAVINFQTSSLEYYDSFGCAWPAECLAVNFSPVYTDYTFSLIFVTDNSRFSKGAFGNDKA